MTDLSEVFRQAETALKDFQAQAQAHQTEARAYTLRQAEHDAEEGRRMARLADLGKEIEEGARVVEATKREAELIMAKALGEAAQIITQAHEEADGVRARYKRIVDGLGATAA